MRGYIFTVLSAAALLAACEADNYDSGTGEYSLMTGDLVEIYSNSSGYLTSFITDDNTSFTLTKNITTSWATSPDSAYRARLYYNLVDEDAGLAEAVSIAEVPVLTPFTPDSMEVIYTDPITLESVWTSKNNKYVNMSIYLMVGTSDEIIDYQTVGMMRDSVVYNADGTSTLYLTFYHSQGDVPEYYSQKYYISLLTQSLVANAQRQSPQTEASFVLADSVSISVNTYDDGLVTKVLPIDAD